MMAPQHHSSWGGRLGDVRTSGVFALFFHSFFGYGYRWQVRSLIIWVLAKPFFHDMECIFLRLIPHTHLEKSLSRGQNKIAPNLWKGCGLRMSHGFCFCAACTWRFFYSVVAAKLSKTQSTFPQKKSKPRILSQKTPRNAKKAGKKVITLSEKTKKQLKGNAL